MKALTVKFGPSKLFLKLSQTKNESEKEEIADGLTELYLPLVERIVNNFLYKISNVTMRKEIKDDLIQRGREELIRRIWGFDLNRGVPFEEHAPRYILGKLKQYIRDNYSSIKISRPVELQMKINRAADQLCFELGRIPTIGEIAEKLEMSPKKIEENLIVLHVFGDLLYLDAPCGDNSSEETDLTLHDVVPYPDSQFEDKLCETFELLRAIPKLERDIKDLIILRFSRGLTQTEIAARKGISQMEVSRRLREGIKKLKEILNKPSDAKERDLDSTYQNETKVVS